MKFMEFKHKDIYVKVHTPLLVTREVEEDNKKREELVFASVINIDSRVQAVFAQLHHGSKADDVTFKIFEAPRIGEKISDTKSFYVRPQGKYKHLGQREDETFVCGIVVSEKVLERKPDGLILFAWDGNLLEKLYWAIDRYYETPFLEEWTPYLFEQLLQDEWLKPLKIHDFTGDYSQLVAYELSVGEKALDDYISLGVKTGVLVLDAQQAKEVV
ncbi:hypothetical protein YDYSY3_38620 [Paenibacillus chitinolyticus]|uniref:hypothetical protein n=1 Tax=Paenibacillus chitinolyticus TaxID=79263 RepID=UPI0026E4C942|nr:hypothetical protein [Paenibacillus chitinolyticus]GKS12862.1 hypothetical protein YDYSY3_38620 [Paenibacillus chitinolyticus]